MEAFAKEVEDARRAYSEGRGRTKTCLICGVTKGPEDRQLSHIIPESVFRAVIRGTSLVRPDTGSKISIGNAGFYGFCANCENLLSREGEDVFAPTVLRPLMENFDRDLVVHDARVFYCLFSIIWRTLAVYPGPNVSASLRWLYITRPYMKRGEVPPEDTFRMFIWVPSSMDVAKWDQDQPCWEGSLHTNLSAGIDPIPNGGGVQAVQHLGPLVVHCVCSTIQIAVTRDAKDPFWPIIPPKFTVPVASSRQPKISTEYLKHFAGICEQQWLQKLRAGVIPVSSCDAPILHVSMPLLLAPRNLVFEDGNDQVSFPYHKEVNGWRIRNSRGGVSYLAPRNSEREDRDSISNALVFWPMNSSNMSKIWLEVEHRGGTTSARLHRMFDFIMADVHHRKQIGLIIVVFQEWFAIDFKHHLFE